MMKNLDRYESSLNDVLNAFLRRNSGDLGAAAAKLFVNIATDSKVATALADPFGRALEKWLLDTPNARLAKAISDEQAEIDEQRARDQFKGWLIDVVRQAVLAKDMQTSGTMEAEVCFSKLLSAHAATLLDKVVASHHQLVEGQQVLLRSQNVLHAKVDRIAHASDGTLRRKATTTADPRRLLACPECEAEFRWGVRRHASCPAIVSYDNPMARGVAAIVCLAVAVCALYFHSQIRAMLPDSLGFVTTLWAFAVALWLGLLSGVGTWIALVVRVRRLGEVPWPYVEIYDREGHLTRQSPVLDRGWPAT